MSSWVLKSVTIEGLRGINNEGDPLVIKFLPDGINSVFAPNAVGKSSIYDSLLFAIRGQIHKLDSLPSAERGKEYYRNRFHSTGIGFVELHLESTDGAQEAAIRVELDANGKRSVTSANCPDPDALLESLNREFALLDYQTFQSFISATPTERGRSFAGLLGLSAYSASRQALQALQNTRAFNNKFQLTQLQTQLLSAQQVAGSNRVFIHKTAASALDKNPEDFETIQQIATEIEEKLKTTAPLEAHCIEKKLCDVNFDSCLSAILEAEGGPKKQEYAALVQEKAKLDELSSSLPDALLFDQLAVLAEALEAALRLTCGAERREVFASSEAVLASQSWPDTHLCPACDETADRSLLDYVRQQLELFKAADAARDVLSSHIVSLGLHVPSLLEKTFINDGEKSELFRIKRQGTTLSISAADAPSVITWQAELRKRLADRLAYVLAARDKLEKELPKSLVIVTKLVEDARAIAKAISAIEGAEKQSQRLTSAISKLKRLKDFLDGACEDFAKAESEATDRRLLQVQPKAKELFCSIMSNDVVPEIKKSASNEAVTIYLEKFFGKSDLSALSLLSESYRNAFAISLYLAAAALYGGGAKFVVLDDVTSSFDGGHQFLLMEAIKSKLARPVVADGLQIIVLSHDTLLEKLFHKNDQSVGWKHQKIEGTPQFLVTPTVGADAKIRATAQKHLAMGHIDEAARAIRMVLEAKLLEIITRVCIPVPIDFAINDHKKMADSALKSITEALALHDAAGTLKVDPVQLANFNTNGVAAIGNFLSHYATGSTSTFTSAALSQVLNAIDALGTVFQTEDPPGSGNYRYLRALNKV